MTPESLRGIAGAVARRYDGRGVDHDDLVSIAWSAAVLGDRRYDESKGMSPTTWAWRQATHACQHAVRDHGSTIRVPRRLWADEQGRDEALRLMTTESLTLEPGEEDGEWLADDPDLTELVSVRIALEGLPPVQRTCVVLYVVADLTQPQIARLVGCSQVHVSRHIRAGLARLRWLLREAA